MDRRSSSDSLKKRWKWILSGLLFIAFALFCWRASVFRISKNFQEVDPGKFYRSAQLTPEELQEAINKYGIKTVVSLRGEPDGSYWVAPQKEVLAKNNVKFEAIWWSSHFFPNNIEFQKYIEVLKNAERPILIHCRSGADRTGEAAAIYAIEFLGKSKEDAISEQLAVLKNWHVPLFHPAKRELVRRYQGFDWVMQKYDMCAPENKEFVEPGHCS